MANPGPPSEEPPPNTIGSAEPLDPSHPVDPVGRAQGEGGDGPQGDPAARPDDGAPARIDRHTVSGERAMPSVNSARSINARVTHLMAMGLVLGLAGAMLGWYYTRASAQREETREIDRKAREAKAAGESRPPRLIRPDVKPDPVPNPGVPVKVGFAEIGTAFAPPPPPVAPVTLLPPPAGTAGGPKPKTPQELERERLLNASVTLRPTAAAAANPMPAPMAIAGPASFGASVGQASPPEMLTDAGARGSGSLAASLRPTATPAVRAQVLPDRQFLLPKGAFIDCTLETALDSTLAGLATCIAPVDIFSADGTVVLIERGTRFVGETRADVRQGQARIGVLWNEARTPQGVSVALASPGTDELGRAGLPGFIDRHFWERFGAAILISVIDGAIQAAVAAQGSGSGTPIYTPNTTRDVLTEVLRSTVNIPPTVIKNQGDRIQILVARDVDFRPVYSLKPRD